jgi:hypothetical protein
MRMKSPNKYIVSVRYHSLGPRFRSAAHVFRWADRAIGY